MSEKGYESVADSEAQAEDPSKLTPSEAANFRSQVILGVLTGMAFLVVVLSIFATSEGAAGEVGGTTQSERPMLDMDDAENLRIIFPYPSEARDDRLVICNNAGTVYYFYAKHTQIYHPIQPVQEDGKCTFLNVTDLCPMGPCDAWEMGVVKACNSWTCAEDEIQPGITVIPGGVSRASCAVLCPKGQAECNSGVIVFIPPVNCFETEIYHNTENAGTLPEGFEQVPLISFPYPSLVAPLKTFLCNFSPDKYYFYWGRIAGNPQVVGGRLTLPPHLPGEKCEEADVPSNWMRGVVAPCSVHSEKCFREKKDNVTAGVTIQPAVRGGVSTCRVRCRAEDGTCETAALVLVSPSKCLKTDVVIEPEADTGSDDAGGGDGGDGGEGGEGGDAAAESAESAESGLADSRGREGS